MSSNYLYNAGTSYFMCANISNPMASDSGLVSVFVLLDLSVVFDAVVYHILLQRKLVNELH